MHDFVVIFLHLESSLIDALFKELNLISVDEHNETFNIVKKFLLWKICGRVRKKRKNRNLFHKFFIVFFTSRADYNYDMRSSVDVPSDSETLSSKPLFEFNADLSFLRSVTLYQGHLLSPIALYK